MIKLRRIFLASFMAAFVAAGCSGSKDVTLFPEDGATEVCPDTHLTVTFIEADSLATPECGWIRICDAQTGACIDSLDLSVPAGLTESRTYGPECDYTKVPYDYSPRAVVPTNRTVAPGTPSGTAEPTPRDMQLTIIGGFTDGFRFYPVIVHGNVATIYLHNNMLEYGHEYVVRIDDEVFGRKMPQWQFSTKTSGPSDPHNLTVDCRGKGDFATVQGALDAVAEGDSVMTTITIAPGDYEEIVYARSKRHLRIIGAGEDQVKVHYANNEVFNPHPLTVKNNEREGAFPYRRAAFALDHCNDIVVKDMTIATDLEGQAEGLLVNGQRVALYNVHVIGDGDALQANGSVYLEGCTIDGGWDTILGRGSLFLYNCLLRNGGGPFTWVRNFKPSHGDVFVECTLEGVGKEYPSSYGRSVLNHGSTYPDAEVVLIDCKTKNIVPQGWGEYDQPTAQLLEYNTVDLESGKPVDVSQRHTYSRQLDAVKDSALISSYRQPAYVLGWDPSQQVESR